MDPIIQIDNVHKRFGHIEALRGVSLEVAKGEVVVVIGPSGSGKSTMLRCINRLEEYDSGHIIVDGISLDSAKNINAVRTEVGMVFQQFNLFPHLTALQNIELAQKVVRHRSSDAARTTAKELLAKVGIPEKADAYPMQLSGGQQQRVAIARALAIKPKLILADEPTANLDTPNGKQVMETMTRLNKETGVTFVFATHDPRVIDYARRVVTLRDGLVAEDKSVGKKA